MNSFDILWNNTLDKLEHYFSQEGNIHVFNTYIRNITPEFEENGRYFFSVSNDYDKEMLEERFHGTIFKFMKDSFVEINGEDHAIEIIFNTPDEIEKYKLNKGTNRPIGGNVTLNPYYTFDTFVVGKSNNLAHAASLAVANNPGIAYNPLFIYGGSGLGKTHLMHAIGNKILEKNPRSNIIYITTEEFINEFIDSIQKHTSEGFRNKFRKVDVLLIDDVHFISRAKETQQELFHTFNTLREQNKQIILSSDKPPEEIPSLEERLISRFKWGLTTDIGLPDYETRVAILKKKAPYIKELTHCTLDIDNDVYSYIASKDESNIRDLEGALKRVIASAQLDPSLKIITLDVATYALDNFFTSSPNKVITPKLVISKVCDYYDITEENLKSQTKSRNIAYPRQIAMYLLKSLTGLTNQKIGEYLGRTNHSTVIHGCNKIASDIEKDQDLKNTVNDITQRIRE
ncbi:MAG: chromosomal replication initiator protein DnaA [Clostridia bacterium]|jgi:chromosomal replication initiator protein|nr:chromosomal replication initiator protein DnaA [Clostridia bacterium]MBR6822064.1 chromosomal replication initiator protein DnaA [Clostridia bacterium]